MQRLKLTREFITSYLKENIPEYEEMLVFFEQNGGWINMPPKMIEMMDRLKVHNYPELYASEETLTKMMLLAFMTVEEINALGAEIKLMREDEKVDCAEELVQFMGDASDTFLENFPDTPEKEQAAKKAYGELSPEDKEKSIKQTQIAMLVFLATFFNTIAIMIHGRKMTDLVQAAEQGDDDAYCLAVQIDRRILSALPYFKERHEKAISGVEIDFLDKLHYRLTNPLFRSKIRYKTLWLAFACLDESGYKPIRLHLDACSIWLYENFAHLQTGVQSLAMTILDRLRARFAERRALNARSSIRAWGQKTVPLAGRHFQRAPVNED